LPWDRRGSVIDPDRHAEYVTRMPDDRPRNLYAMRRRIADAMRSYAEQENRVLQERVDALVAENERLHRELDGGRKRK
jgi:hypothetical protein